MAKCRRFPYALLLFVNGMAIAQAQSTLVPSANVMGKGLVCLLEDASLARGKLIELQATTIFEDGGQITGKETFPRKWRRVKNSKETGAKIALVEPIVLSAEKRCASGKFEMFIDREKSPVEARGSESRVFYMSDVLNYQIPDSRPAIEVSRLVEDMNVAAILFSDVVGGQQRRLVIPSDEDAAKQCLQDAAKLAVHMGVGLGRQTSSVVFLHQTPFPEASFGCPFGAGAIRVGDLGAGWSGNPRPSSAQKAFIADAGEFLTGARKSELMEELDSCVTEALKPDAMELARRDFRGAVIECQAFRRSGGGGFVTVYRRYGPSPSRPEPNADQLLLLKQRSGG